MYITVTTTTPLAENIPTITIFSPGKETTPPTATVKTQTVTATTPIDSDVPTTTPIDTVDQTNPPTAPTDDSNRFNNNYYFLRHSKNDYSFYW